MSQEKTDQVKKAFQVHLKVDHIGKGTVVLDGFDLGHYVGELTLRCKVGQLSEPTLVIPAANVTADVEAFIMAHTVPLIDVTTAADTYRRFVKQEVLSKQDEGVGGEDLQGF